MEGAEETKRPSHDGGWDVPLCVRVKSERRRESVWVLTEVETDARKQLRCLPRFSTRVTVAPNRAHLHNNKFGSTKMAKSAVPLGASLEVLTIHAM
jgi:hypothetical protein